ncbi:hypothetical protein HBH82_006510 [Parastagonospora nodorum]|nr:hypothetical protein HBH82_006510 [Parastagonospora nodorum]KAH4668017.1 hypothetical protein HBH78_194920 [Parastagonospora nodorum]KAH4691639.1 hypothetical protein HBH67_239910 [Parastagonospora nodorum]KAH4794065.1 hypothetical protein HBH62_005570 [Parastagonospora nodorum]KAH4838018.1 hypothetical protein HBH63_003220 [Parastagonospora nodorum]
MIKFCWTKACPLCGAALKSKYSLYTLRCNSFLSLFCLLTPHPPKRHLHINTHFQQQSNDYIRSLTVFYSRREAIMAGRDSDDDSDIEWAPLKQLEWYKSKANTISSNSMSQTNVREGYGITTLEVVELVEDLISYLLKSLRLLTLKDWLAVAKCIRLRNAQISKVFYEAAAGTIWTMMLAKVRYNTLTLTLSETAQRRSSSVVSNRSTALITDKFGVALLTEPAILNDANVALVDAVHYSVVMDALTMTLIEDDDDLLGTVNSHIKSRRLGARRKTEAADSRHAKASGGRTKKDKDLEDSDTGSDVLRLRRRDRAAARARLAERKRLGKEAQLKKTRDEEELAKAKKEKEEKEARETRDGLSARVGTAMEHCTLEEWTSAAVFFGVSIDDFQNKRTIKLLACWGVNAYILYFKELLSDNGGIFANAMGMGKTRAMVLAVLMGHVHFKNWTEVQNARAEGDAIEHNAVDDDDKLCSTEGERTFYCACERSPSFNAEPRQAAIMMTGWGRAADAWKNEVVAMDLANSTWCDLSDPLALRFCFFSDSPPENMGRLTKEEVMEMRIDTTDAISKALAAANKLVALRSYVLGGATKHRLALSAARFVIVCGFGKVDKHVFRAYNTMSVTAQRTIIRKGGPYVEKRAILLPGYVTVWGRTVFDEFYNCKSEGTIMAKKGVSNWFNATDKRDSVTGDRIYKMEDAVYWFMLKRTLKTRDLWGKLISGIKGDFLTVQNAEQQCRDILEKEGLDESEASRRVIFNCFEMQAIASYSALATLKAAQFKTYGSCKVKRFTLNSVKDLFTNLSKDYFLVREARAITKSSLNRTWSIAAEDAAKAANILLLLKEVRAKILIGSYKLIVQAVTWLGLREKFGDESVLVMQGGMTQHEINLKLAKWRDLDGPWIMVALMAFAEAIILTEATHVLAEMCVGIVYFNLDSELELKVLGKQDVKTTSRDKLQGGGSTVTD